RRTTSSPVPTNTADTTTVAAANGRAYHALAAAWLHDMAMTAIWGATSPAAATSTSATGPRLRDGRTRSMGRFWSSPVTGALRGAIWWARAGLADGLGSRWRAGVRSTGRELPD